DDARTVGVLLSARGLTELIALEAGLRAGLLSGPLYSVLVFMALITTLLTQPLLGLVRRPAGPAVGTPAAPGKRKGAPARAAGAGRAGRMGDGARHAPPPRGRLRPTAASGPGRTRCGA